MNEPKCYIITETDNKTGKQISKYRVIITETDTPRKTEYNITEINE
jgi:hypothetical protein